MKNYKKLVEIISNDCQIRESYIDEDGHTCAIGAMLRETGYPGNIHSLYYIDQRPDGAVKHLKEQFGLTRDQLRDIQDRNDRHFTPETRRKSILSYLARQK